MHFGEGTHELQCSHGFHTECREQHRDALYEARSLNHIVCPLCRAYPMPPYPTQWARMETDDTEGTWETGETEETEATEATEETEET